MNSSLSPGLLIEEFSDNGDDLTAEMTDSNTNNNEVTVRKNDELVIDVVETDDDTGIKAITIKSDVPINVTVRFDVSTKSCFRM